MLEYLSPPPRTKLYLLSLTSPVAVITEQGTISTTGHTFTLPDAPAVAINDQHCVSRNGQCYCVNGTTLQPVAFPFNHSSFFLSV